jgi:zinc/manganese transport system permease protein
MTQLWSGEPFSWNLITDLRTMLAFDFMVNAFAAGTIIAIVAGIVGYFVVLRRSSFASHALGHTGFSGAAAAVLVGVDPVFGLLLFTMTAASAMALLGTRASTRDVEIGTVLAFALGLGLLFLSLYQGYATEAYSILFGEVLGISASGVSFTLWAGAVVMVVVAIIYRPLLFASLDEDVAEAKGMPMLFLSLTFFLLLAVTISIAVQIVGVLLIFALMVTPAAIAVRLTKRVATAVIVAILVSVTAVWAGLFIGFYLNAPVSFFITGIIFGEYVIIRGLDVLRESPYLQAIEAPAADGVRSLRNAAVATVAAQVLLVVGLLQLFLNLSTDPSAAWRPMGLWSHARFALLGLAAAAVASAAAFVLYLSGFRKMAAGSREFTPAAFLTLTGIAGLPLLVLGLGLFVGGVGLNSTGYALAPVMILFGVPLLALGLVLATVGLYGQAAGSWRAGDHYGEPVLRAAAILEVVPILGSAIAFVGYRRVLARTTALSSSAPPVAPT